MPLYRRILRLHRFLPPDLRSLGDSYVSSEFRLHRKSDGAQLQSFLGQWDGYARGLEEERDRRFRGEREGWGRDMEAEDVNEQQVRFARLCGGCEYR